MKYTVRLYNTDYMVVRKVLIIKLGVTLMRKKSHMSLSMYLVDSMDNELLENHKKAFIMGSILPDCKPSFVTTKHNIDETFDIVCRFIDELTVDTDGFKRISTAYCRKLGEVTHYLADYFTFPHNDIFDGNIREHCKYEKHLKKALKQYIRSRHVAVNRQIIDSLTTPQDLIDYVIKIHNQYLSCDKTVESDCMYIVSLCHVIVAGILNILTMNRNIAAA